MTRSSRVGAVGVDQAVAETADRAARRRRGVVVGAFRGPDGAVAGRGDDGTGAVPGERTLFEIGSVTKVFTGLLLADGVLRGEWTLDTPVAELLPGVAIPERNGGVITVAHLATHTSGLPRSPIPNLSGSIDMLRGRDPYAGLTTDLFLERVGRMQLGRTPGSGKHRYSNTGAGLLGVALERASGMAYDELVRERICGPLQLGDTVSRRLRSAEQEARTARGHRGRDVPAPEWPLTGLMGAGALLSTAADLLRFLRWQQDPPSGPLGDAIRLTHQPRPGLDPAVGLGWMRSERRLGLWHNGGTAGFRSFVGVGTTRPVGVALLTNRARMLDLLGTGLFASLTS